MSVKVGDKISFNTNLIGVTVGKDYEVVSKYGRDIAVINDAGKRRWLIYPSKFYEVIPQRKSSEDLIASLAQTVTQLERELNELKYKYEIDREMFIDDIAMIDERTQSAEANIVRKTVAYEYAK